MLCENVLFLYILKYFKIAVNIARFAIPIVLIFKLGLDIYGQILDPKSNEAKDKITRRIMACVIIFFVPTFVNILLGFMENIFGTSFNYSECIANTKNINYYVGKKEKEAALLAELENTDNLNKYKINMEKAREEIEYNLAHNFTSSGALVMGQKYLFLSDEELNGLCSVARAEQGRVEGAKFEASLMANLYELLPEDSKYYNNGLYNYVRNSGWFSDAKKHMAEKCPDKYMEAVRDVLVNGNRTIPLYVNEHDCFNCNDDQYCSDGKMGDICAIGTNGEKYTSLSVISTRSDKYYVPNETKIYTVYYDRGGEYNYWMFYGFVKIKDSDGNEKNVGDPFGYSVDAKKKFDEMNK